jgi:hypothetical protein
MYQQGSTATLPTCMCLAARLVAMFLSYSFESVTEYDRPPLWSSGQSSWLQIRRPEFDSRHYQIFRPKKKESK